MVIKNDNQRKAMFAKMNANQPKAPTRPTFLQRLRRRVRPTEQEKTEARGRRIAREGEELQAERATERQLALEARVETEREAVARRTRRARTELREIDVERTRRRFAPVIRGARAVGRGIVRVRKSRVSRRRIPRVRTPREEPASLPFGMDSEPAPRRRKGNSGETGFFGIE